MSSELFKVSAVGTDEFKRVMEGVVRFASRPALAMRDMAAILEDQTEQNFAAQGRPKWEPLAPATRFKRIGGAKGYNKKGELTRRSKRVLEEMMILQDTGRLAASVHSRHGDDYVVIGASAPYARIHQLGGEAGRGRQVKIPARPYLPFSSDGKLQPEAEQALLKSGTEHLRRAMK